MNIIRYEWSDIAYVTHHYGYSDDPTLSRTFKAYTPSEPGKYKVSLLLSIHLNPIDPEHSKERVVYGSTSDVYVYSGGCEGHSP